MNDSTPSALRISGLAKHFPGPGGTTVRAVDGLDLTVERGEIVAFLGPNGAGKTTTLDMVLGLTEPTAGSIEVFGLPPRRAITDGRVSAVLQTGGLLPDITVRETLEYLASTFAAPDDVDDILERVGISALAGRRVSKCSGGEQQRLKFAMSLICSPDLLILDEPTTGMDVNARNAFWTAMRAEAATGRTVMFATHYLAEAEDFAQRIVLIAGGRVVADGTTDELRARSSARRVTAVAPRPTGEELARQMRALAGVREVTAQPAADGVRLTTTCTDSDAVARHLLAHGARELEIDRGSLDQTFADITAAAAAEQEKNR